MNNIFNFDINEKTFYNLSENISDSSEYGGNTLNNIAEAKPWMTCYVQFLNYLRICKYINKEDIVLDVGCGQAELLTVMRNNFLSSKYIGIEINENNLKKSKSKFRKSEREVLLKQDVTIGLPIKDNSIDMVTCNLLLEHLPKEKSFFVFSELVRVCKPNGYITIMMPIRYTSAQPMSQEKHIYEWLISDFKEQANKYELNIIEKYFTNVKLKDIKSSGYSNLLDELKGKIDNKLLRAVLAPLCERGEDLFVCFKKEKGLLGL